MLAVLAILTLCVAAKADVVFVAFEIVNDLEPKAIKLL